MVGDILQPTHLLFILVVALLVLGPKRLPEVGRTLGSGLRDFRNALSGETDEPHYTPRPEAEAVASPEPVVHAEPSPAPAPAHAAPVERPPDLLIGLSHEIEDEPASPAHRG